MKCFKQGLMCRPSRNMKDSDAEGNLNYGGLNQEDSEEKNVTM